MKPLNEPHGLCSMDPISLVGLAGGGLAGLLGGMMGGGGGNQSTTAPMATPAPPPQQQSPTTKKPQARNPAGFSSFIGSAASPNTANAGGKTLIGSV